MPLSHHVCHHLSLSSIFALVLRVGSSISILKAKQRNLPRRSWTWWLPPIFLETTMIIMVRFLHAVLSGCCMHQQQQLKNTYKERPVMSIFDVLERSTVWRWQNTELLQWWHKLKKIAELVTGIQFYRMDNDARILTRVYCLTNSIDCLLWFATTKKTEKIVHEEFCFCWSSFRIRVGLRKNFVKNCDLQSQWWAFILTICKHLMLFIDKQCLLRRMPVTTIFYDLTETLWNIIVPFE